MTLGLFDNSLETITYC